MVNATTYFAPTRSATSSAAFAITPLRVCGSQSIEANPPGPVDTIACSSVDAMIRAMVSTVWTGYSPTLVSPDSITASAPSSTAFATSEASARVGAGLEIIDSQHLGGDDDRLGVEAGPLDDLLLQERHVLERALHRQVAARHHEAVEGGDDLVEVLDRLRLLDLGDHRHHALFAHDLADVVGVRPRCARSSTR